jgi:hypothetical protein
MKISCAGQTTGVVETELKAPNTTLDGFKEATQEMKTFE